jgi:hypothetical protein
VNQFAVGLALGSRQRTSKRNSIVPAASNTKEQNEKNRVDTQIWPSCVSCALFFHGNFERHDQEDPCAR